MKIGCFADAHYARGLMACHTRTCGRSLVKLERILHLLRDCDVIVNLGDLVNASGDAASDACNLSEALELLDGRVLNVVGNHDVETARKCAFAPTGVAGACYALTRNGWTLCVLDANFNAAGESYEDAHWDWRESLVPEAQLDWLRATLSNCERALVFCHQNLDPRMGDPHVALNASRVRETIEACGKVSAVIQGHCHPGYEQLVNGIPYFTLSAVCEGDGAPYAIYDTESGRFERCDAYGQSAKA